MRLFPSIVLAVLLLGSPALAELTSYEQRTLAECAARLGVSPEPDPEPDGKLIERIDIVVLDVFDEHDPVPDFFNVFHAMSRKVVIGNELLFHEGERYVRARVDESARNLRTLQQQLSLVLAVPSSFGPTIGATLAKRTVPAGSPGRTPVASAGLRSPGVACSDPSHICRKPHVPPVQTTPLPSVTR